MDGYGGGTGKGPLAGVRVLDLTRALAGPYGSMILGDLGAEIIKIEEPGARTLTPGAPLTYNGEGVYYLSINRNKKSITLDLRQPAAREAFYELVKRSDVVFDNYRAGVTRKLKVDFETLKKINPRIIICSLTGYGPDGPYRDRPSYDLIVQAMGGGMSITGEPGRPPARSGIPIGDLAGGMFAAHGIMSALYARERTGEAQTVDVTLLDCQIGLLTYVASYWLNCGVLQEQIGSRHMSIPVYGAYKTRDDYIVLAPAGAGFWEPLCRGISREDLIKDPRFETPAKRREPKNREELEAIVEQAMLTRTADEWVDIMVKADVPCGKVNSIAQALDDPQVRHRNMVVTIDHTLGGQIKLAGNPIKTSAGEPRFTSPPTLGEHTEEILTGMLGYSAEKVAALREAKAI